MTLTNAERRSVARKGTVCAHCWLRWGGDDSTHRACCDVWDDPGSPNGLTVCMCGCVRRKEEATPDPIPPTAARQEATEA